jgi:hypothetical protein
MNILVIHRIPYQRIDYARGIDHTVHDVTYLGSRDLLATLPGSLHCARIERSGMGTLVEETLAWLESRPTNAAHFERLIALSEYDLLDAAQLRERLGIPGARPVDVRPVRDKIAMKEAVERVGLRVPRYLPLAKFIEGGVKPEWHGKTVLKPHSGASSEDVVVFSSPAAAQSAVGARSSGAAKLDTGALDLDSYEIEEFISGDILHFDGLISDGTLLAMSASIYVGTCLGFAQGLPLGSSHIPVDALARDWVPRVLAAVGIRNGSLHLEAIDDGDLVFLEVGNRVGGADVVPTFELATDVHLPSEELRILIDGAPSRPFTTTLPHTQAGGPWHGWFVFPGHAGRLAGDGAYRRIGGIDAFRDDPAVVRWTELATGMVLQPRVTYSAHEAPLAGIVAHGDWQDTRAWIEALFQAAMQTPKQDDVATGSELAQRVARPNDSQCISRVTP